MKNYSVLFERHAEQEALEAAEYIARSSPANAAKWFAGLARIIDSLRTMPGRCSQARESKTLGIDLRQSAYRSHRIIFRIEEQDKIVRILHIRHAARRAIDELEE